MRRFFTYQYGKVGSTSLVEALNKLPDAEAYQSLFLGEAASSDTLTRLMNPEVPDYFFHQGLPVLDGRKALTQRVRGACPLKLARRWRKSPASSLFALYPWRFWGVHQQKTLFLAP